MRPTVSMITEELICTSGSPETFLERVQMNDLREMNFGGAAFRDSTFDEYDRNYKYCSQIVAIAQEKVVGYARAIKYPAGPLPLEWNFDFEKPDELKLIAKEETGEIDYLFLHPEVESPQIVLFSLLAAAIDSFKGQGISGGYIVTKKQIKDEVADINSCSLIEVKNFRKKLEEKAAFPSDVAVFAFLTENLWKAIRKKAQNKGWKMVFAREVLSWPNVSSLL